MTRTPYLVLFVVLGAIAISTASAVITITFDGFAIFKENVQMYKNLGVDGNLNVDGNITGAETLEGLSCLTDQVARWNGTSWVCGKFAIKENLITTVDGAGGNKGEYTSIAIGDDGNPVISYYDDFNGNLKVLHCGDVDCAQNINSNTITTVDITGVVGKHTSIAIGDDGFPVISYWDATNFNLKVAKCVNISCTGTSTITTVDDGGGDVVGRYTSITLGDDGFPVISYFDNTNQHLKVAKCHNAACTGNTKTMVDSGGDVGYFTSITLGDDGFPVISYLDGTNEDLKVAKCLDAACTTSNKTTVDSAGDVGGYTSIAIGDDGFPLISYYDATNGDLKVIHCGNTLCSSGSTNNAVDTIGDVGRDTSIAIGRGGNPVISYYDVTNKDLKVAVEGFLIGFD